MRKQVQEAVVCVGCRIYVAPGDSALQSGHILQVMQCGSNGISCKAGSGD